MSTYIIWGTRLLMVFIVIMMAVVSTYLYRMDLINLLKGKYKQIKQRRFDKSRQDLDKRIEYDMIDEMLLRKGAKFRMGDNFSPFDYLMLRLLVGVLFAFIGLVINPLFVIVGFLLGYYMVSFYFEYENKNDSKDMMDDVAAMFGIVSLQLRNGVYLSQVIYECYLNTTHPRLKKALLELSLEMEKFGNVKEAAVSFRSKFEDKYLDSFSKTLEQAEETGNAVDLLKDLENQVEGINEAIAIREEQKVNNTAFFMQTLVFLGALAFMVYVLFSMFSSSMKDL